MGASFPSVILRSLPQAATSLRSPQPCAHGCLMPSWTQVGRPFSCEPFALFKFPVNATETPPPKGLAARKIARLLAACFPALVSDELAAASTALLASTFSAQLYGI